MDAGLEAAAAHGDAPRHYPPRPGIGPKPPDSNAFNPQADTRGVLLLGLCRPGTLFAAVAPKWPAEGRTGVRIIFNTLQEFRASVGSDLAGLLGDPDGFEVQRAHAYRAARSAGDDLTLDAPTLDDSDLRRIKRRPLGDFESVRRLGGTGGCGAGSRRGA